jgi:hypothetical protein
MPKEFDCYWEVDGSTHYWPLTAQDAISAARTFAAEYDVTNNPDDPTAVCIVVPQKGGDREPSGSPERFRAYATGGKLRVEPLDLHTARIGTRNAVPDDMSKACVLSLSDRDKTPAPSGFGYHFHHTAPQRRVPCVLGDMLAPLSADDIPPITPEAMASVQAALTLLANLVGDQDLGRFMGHGDAELEEYREKGRGILSTARGLAGILRVVTPTAIVEQSPVPAPKNISAATTVTGTTPTATATGTLLTTPSPPLLEVGVQLSAVEVTALAMAGEHVRLSMAHSYSWASRDTAMEAISKVLNAARAARHLTPPHETAQ